MIHGREIDFEEYVNLLRKGSVHFYNDYEDIVYKAIIDINAGRVRYFAKKIGRGREYEVFKETSNMGGNSGACLVEVASSRVIGLHFGGLYGQNNYAVPLWQLAEDSFFKGYGLHFA